MQGRQKKAGWSEYLLPFLFAGMETCCIDAIFIALADMGILGTNDTLLPLWLPFVLISTFYIIAHYIFARITDISTHTLSQKDFRILANPLLIVIVSGVTCFVCWVSLYASQTSLFNPAWMLNLPGVVLQFNEASFRLVGVIVFSVALCKHGEFLAHNKIGSSQVFVVMRFGAVIVIVLLIVQKLLELMGKTTHDGFIVPLLVFLFFCLAFVTHALAHVISVRRRHVHLLFQGVSKQERVTLQMAVVVSCILFIVAFMVSNMFQFIRFLHTELSSHRTPIRQYSTPPSPTCTHGCGTPVQQNIPTSPIQQAIHGLSPTAITLFAVLLILLLTLTVGMCIVAMVYYVRRQQNRQAKDIHESIWAWSLFWSQFRGFLSALLSRLLPGKVVKQGSVHILGETSSIPAICGIYRSFLNRAAICGYPRLHFETPYEFSTRLVEYMPSIEPELSILTAAYVKTRYGNMVSEHISYLQDTWAELEQKLLREKQPFPKGATHGAEASQHRAFTGAGYT